MINVAPSFVLILGTVFRMFYEYLHPSEPIEASNNHFQSVGYIQAALSPDGKWLSYLADYNGAMNVWIRPLKATDNESFPVTFSNTNLNEYSWIYDSQHITTVRDLNGDENWQMFKTNINTKTTETVFEGKGAQILVSCISSVRKSEILVSINERDKRYHDAYLINIETGAKTLVYLNVDSFYGPSFFCDQNLSLRLAYKSDEDGGRTYYKRNTTSNNWEKYRRLEPDEIDTRPISVDKSDKKVYWADNSGKRDKMTLIIANLEDWEKDVKILHENIKSDVIFSNTDSWLSTSNTYFRSFDHLPLYVVEDYLREIKYDINGGILSHFRYLNKEFPTSNDINIVQTTLDGSKWVISYSTDTFPRCVYLYDLNTKSLSHLAGLDATKNYNRKLSNEKFVPTHALEIQTRDNLIEVCYLSLPKKSDPEGTGRPAYVLPFYLEVHGGPWVRDYWGFNPSAQLITSKGYAHLSCNFRSSVGYGKAFLAAGNGQWGAAMQSDLTDAVNWAIRRRIAHPDRILISGASYGGYAALAGLTFTPDLYTCAIDEFGPSNLQELFKNLPPYWQSLRSRLIHRIAGGRDPMSKEGREFLASRSPINFVDKIVRPLLVIAGGNDVRVPEHESDQIATAMAKRGIPLLYIQFPNEGHGVSKPANSKALNLVKDHFIAKCLGGIIPAIDYNELSNSSLQFKYGSLS